MKKKENVYKNLRENTETDKRPALTQEELAREFAKEGNPITQSVISKLETSNKNPPTKSIEVIKAYSEHFKVTADYLLGLRNTSIIDENIVMISQSTGLSDMSINKLKKYSSSDKVVLNALIEEEGIALFTLALKNHYRQTFQTLNIQGLGKEERLSQSESNKIFKYLSNEFVYDIFNRLIHNKSITNTFLNEAVNLYYDSMKNALIENNSLYEQTEERKEFLAKVLNDIESEKNESNHTDYYEEFLKGE